VRREAYQFKEQLPSDHIKNLEHYLLIMSSLTPRDPALSRFCIHHPDLQPSNVIISRSPNSILHIVSLIGWQYTSILPLFLLAGIPKQLQNDDDLGSQCMWPLTPENLDDMGEIQLSEELELYHCRLVHYHYIKSMEKYNKLHYAALVHPMILFCQRLFCNASDHGRVK
jgi:hypothetical protein